MIGKMYTGSIGSEARTDAVTLMYLETGAATINLIERMWIKQTNFDTSENLGLKVQRGTAAGTDTDIVLEPLQVGDVHGGTWGTNSSIEPTITADTEIIEDGFNVLSGWLWTPASDDEVIEVTPASDVMVTLDVAPSTTMNFSYGMTVRELG